MRFVVLIELCIITKIYDYRSTENESVGTARRFSIEKKRVTARRLDLTLSTPTHFGAIFEVIRAQRRRS